MVINHVQTGEDFEREILGISHQEAQKAVSPFSGTRNFDACVKHAKDNQGRIKCDPRKPRNHFSRLLHSQVAAGLRHLPKKDLRFFVSVGMPLDNDHGIDCFFEYHGALVTLDLTISRRKERPKADVVLTLDDLRLNLHYAMLYRISSLLAYRVQAMGV